MPLAKEQQRATPASVIRDVVGEALVALYVTVRHPLSEGLLDGPAIVVIVDKHRAEGRSYVSELPAEIADQTGAYHEVFVYAEDERANITLRDEDVVEV